MSDPDPRLDEVVIALATGDLAGARARIEAAVHDLPEDCPKALRSRAARTAATVHRLSGDYASSQRYVIAAIEAAADQANADPLVAVEAEQELGDLRRAQGRLEEAVSAYERADRLAERAGMPDVVRWKLALRMVDLDLAHDPARAASRMTELVQQVPDVPDDVLDPLPRSLRALVEAMEPVAAGDDEAALKALDVVATKARESQDVPAYVAARLATAQILDQRDDHVGAYRSLATGWATLRAAIGPRAAEDAFHPAVHDLRDRWGEDEFVRVKHELDKQIKASRRGPPAS